MNIAYINPLIEASMRVIKQTTGFNTSVGKINITKSPYKNNNVVVIIGLTGEIKGNAVLCFKRELACKIVSAMMGGYPVNELDDIAKSAISELCNMIMGNTATLYTQQNIRVNITPPTVLTGENLEITVHKSVVLNIPLVFDSGEQMEIDISYYQKDKSQ